MKENRRHHRLAFEVPVELKRNGSKIFLKKRAILVKTKNISKDGLFITTNKTYPPGTLLKLTLRLYYPDEPVHLTAKVVWVAKKRLHPNVYPGMGLHIVHISPEDRRRIAGYVLEKSKNYKDALELQQMYFSLKNMAARLVELQERHSQAVNFKKVVDTAIEEIDAVAHIIDKEVWEVRQL